MVVAVAPPLPYASHTKPMMSMEDEPLYARVHKKPRNTPEDHQQNSLEAFYGGKFVANQAAFVIQQAYRAHLARRKQQSVVQPEVAQDHLDLLILQAAGLETFASIATKKKCLKRSMSLRVARRGMITSPANKARDDLDPGPSPPPQPCPALRGHYGEIPKPPQRTVSFLAKPTLPQKVASVNQKRPLPPPPVMAFSTDGLHSVPVEPVTNHHLRSYSSPAVAPGSVVIDIPEDPLPPPPYISPPLPSDEPPVTPSPPPPPPPELFMDEKPTSIAPRPPCDSSSSASSIDSGFRSSFVESPTNFSVASPHLLVSPESLPAIKDVVFEPRQHSVSNLYGIVNSSQTGNNTKIHRNCSLVKKKSVKFNHTEFIKEEREGQSLALDEVTRRRQYRVGLNLFNQCPELGMEYLFKKDFLDYSPASVGKFLLGRKGLSKSMVGQYLCQIQRPFNVAALHCFVHEMDFSGLHLDIALRHLYKEISPPTETAQKVEKIMEVFAKRYIACNQMFANSFRSADTIFVLSYAIVLLNTDLHSKALRPGKRMKKDDFVRNLKGADLGADLDSEMLQGIYDRIKGHELKAGADHVSQVARVEETITKSRDALSLSGDTSRRLVCFCRLTEVPEAGHKKTFKATAEPLKHQRGVFLFNDLLVITKSVSKKERTTHQFRSTLALKNLRVNVFSTAQYPFGVQLQDKLTCKVTATFNARSEEDQQRFVNDLEESIHEMTEMERAKSVLNDNYLNEVLDDQEDAYETLC